MVTKTYIKPTYLFDSSDNSDSYDSSDSSDSSDSIYKKNAFTKNLFSHKKVNF